MGDEKMYVSRSIHSGQSDAFSCRKRRMKTDRRLLSGTAVMLVLSMLLTLSSCSKSGGTDDSFAVWKWILKPTVVCDDIQPVILFGYKYENGIPQYNKNNSQAYDKVSLILNRSDNDPLYSNIDEQYYGLIAYNGLEIFPCRSDFIYATQNSDEKLIYITDREYNEYIDEHYMINSFTDYDEPMETDSILYWIKQFDCLMDCELGGVYSKDSAIQYNEPIAVFYSDEYEKEGKNTYVAISDGKMVLLNNGKIISDRFYDDAGNYVDGIIPLKYNGKWGYVDKNGHTVIPFEFDSINEESEIPAYDASCGFVVVKKNGKYAVYNTKGKLVLDYGILDEIRPVYNNMAWVKKDGKWGVIGLTADAGLEKAEKPTKRIKELQGRSVVDGYACPLLVAPGKNHDSLGGVDSSNDLVICGYTNDWVYVRNENVYGWAESQFIEVFPDEITDYDSDKIKKALNYGKFLHGHLSGYEDPFNIRQKDSIGLAIAYYLTYFEKPEHCKKLKSGKSVFGNNQPMYEYNDVDKLEKTLYDMYHIKLSRDKNFIKYNEYAAYKNGAYYFRRINNGKKLSAEYTCNKVYQIKDDLLCVIANVKGTNADDASKFADTIIAVVYTGGSQYALLQYYTMWIHLTRAEYLYYSTQFK